MFLRPKDSLRFSLCYVRKCMGFSHSRNFYVTRHALLRKVPSSRKKSTEILENESNLSVAGELVANVPPRKVNDNFFGIESDEGVIEINDKPSLKTDAGRQLLNIAEQEKLITTTFGTVRYDSENKPRHHGQLEKDKVHISSEEVKHKIRELSQKLLHKNAIKNHIYRKHNSSKSCLNTNIVLEEKSEQENLDSLPRDEKVREAVTDSFDRNSKFKSPSSSYVDEFYFPDSYAEKDNCSIFKSESLQSSSADDKSNFVKECYFSDKMTDEAIFKNVDITSENISSTNKNQALSVAETSKSNADEKLLSLNDGFYDNISESNLKSTVKENLQSNLKATIVLEEKFNQENLVMPLRDEKVSEFDKNLFNTESEISMTHSKFSGSNVKLCIENSIGDRKTEISLDKTLLNLNENTERNYIDVSDEQSSLELINPNLEEFESSNKFKSSLGHLPTKKNKFLFECKEFLKGSDLKNSNISKTKSKLFQKKFDEENIQNEEEMVKSLQEAQIVKEQNEKSVENSKHNEQPETAFDFVKKLRSTKKKLDPELVKGKFIQKTEQYDSKGFRILKNQVPDLKYYTRDEILDSLAKNVLYSDDDLVVLNKPYNLVMHESKTAKDPCLSQYLDDLAAELDKKAYKPKLITVHRLDKETTGCLLLARNEISAQRLLSFFFQRKIIKTYWIVTIKVPDPLEGIIDMPISEGSIGGRARMVLHPDLPKDISYQNHSKYGKRAVTHYKVIAESGSAALVEAKPETGIKHQIRVHFGFGLSCPILGDHKYSHLDKLVPQKLQADLLQRLHVRQSKVRHIPMHIYARSILIPQYRDGKNLFVMAPMPVHMSKNLQKLKFKKN